MESNKVAARKVRTHQHASFALTLHGVYYAPCSVFFFKQFHFLIGSEIDPIINGFSDPIPAKTRGGIADTDTFYKCF